MLTMHSARYLDRSRLGSSDGLRVAFVSTYPPRECGLATFCEDVVKATCQNDLDLQPLVVAMENSARKHEYAWPVVRAINDRDVRDYEAAADFLNSASVDVVCLQHEFGIFGGDEADGFCRFLELLEKPIIANLHTVLPEPELHITKMIRKLAKHSEYLTIFNGLAADILEETYGIARDKLRLIHHGAPAPFAEGREEAKRRLGLEGRRVLSTFGLISRGKGLEYALAALPQIRAKHPEICYLIIGQTHPGVQHHEKETYRESLLRYVEENDLQESVHFVNRYLTKPEIISYLGATDIYLTPYLNPHQIVSGTLAYAVAAGRAVVSTPYLYGQFLLDEGRGELVPFRSAEAVAETINRILEDPVYQAQLEFAARDYGRDMLWPTVGKRYCDLFEEVTAGALPSRRVRAHADSLWLSA